MQVHTQRHTQHTQTYKQDPHRSRNREGASWRSRAELDASEKEGRAIREWDRGTAGQKAQRGL